MCGIAGYIGTNDDSELIKRMADKLIHRGPDEEGFYRSTNIALASRRLRIIDLNTGTQPISNETNDIWVVFNGEIYNYSELRELLLKKGHIFKTNSDTEVIVHLFEEYGERFPEHLIGMFAIALWDEKKETLYIVRDHLGKKPLFYYFSNGFLVFASEVKSILEYRKYTAEVELEGLHYFLNLRWVPGEKTLFKNIYNLLPAHILKFSKNKIEIKRYWNLDLNIEKEKDTRFYTERISELLKQSVKRRLMSDVPLGAFLSGGIDSTAIVAMMSELANSPVKTFTLGFNDPTDEVDDAKKVSNYFSTEHHELMVDNNPLRFLPETIWYAEIPKVNSIQMYLISQFARNYVTVALSGLGGDELFGGYDNYLYIKPTQFLHKYIPLPLRKAFGSINNFILERQLNSEKLNLDEYRRGIQMLLSLGDKTRYYLILRNVWDGDLLFYNKIYSKDILEQQKKHNIKNHFDNYFSQGDQHMLAQVMRSELSEKIVADQIWLEDRMSMAHSLESRCPFLDKDLVEFCVNIPDSLKIKGLTTKFIFKEAMKGKLPEFIFNKPKRGFAFNPYRQFQRDLKKTAEIILNRGRIQNQGLFNYDYIKHIIDYPPSKSMQWHYFYLWNLVGFQIWYDLFILKDRSLEELKYSISL